MTAEAEKLAVLAFEKRCRATRCAEQGSSFEGMNMADKTGYLTH